MARQNDGCLKAFPIWDDVRTFDGRPWRGIVDVVSGGFPCQDISAAGKGAGIEGERSGLWSEFARIIGEVQPRFVFVENSPMLTSRGLGTVLGDLAAMGFDAEWGVLGAHHSGAPHKRDRIWILARNSDCDSEPTQSVHDEAPRVPGLDVSDTYSERRRKKQISELGRGNSSKSRDDGAQEYVADAQGERSGTRLCEARQEQNWNQLADGGRHVADADACSPGWWATEPNVGRVAHGLAARVDRLRCIGNGQVPAVAALAWKTLSDRSASHSTPISSAAVKPGSGSA
jgi:DNA (cytosine-5)-methyltransferase 1